MPPDRKSAPRRGNAVPERDVAAMFDEIAPVYDRMNTLMTIGLDGGWRREAVRAANVGPGGRVVDVACGTGKLARELAVAVSPGGTVAGVDLAPVMIETAQRLYPNVDGLTFQVGNALALPFETGAFDAATIAFGLRNLADFEAGFRELGRVVRPGGRVVCLELSVPRPEWWGRFYHWAFRTFAPKLGSLFGSRGAYAYLPASLEGFPRPDSLAQTMRAAGLVDVRFRRLFLGGVALHVGTVAPR